jgi:hypothetical protein
MRTFRSMIRQILQRKRVSYNLTRDDHNCVYALRSPHMVSCRNDWSGCFGMLLQKVLPRLAKCKKVPTQVNL